MRTRNEDAAQSSAALTLRLPAELHEQLSLYSVFTRRSINEIATEVLNDWLSSTGRRELVDLIAERGLHTHAETLEKLKHD